MRLKMQSLAACLTSRAEKDFCRHVVARGSLVLQTGSSVYTELGMQVRQVPLYAEEADVCLFLWEA